MMLPKLDLLARGALLCATASLCAPLTLAHEPESAPLSNKKANFACRVAKVVVMDEADTIINDAVVLVSEGKIAAVGKKADIKIPEGYTLIDQPECWIVPGLVEAHNHTASGSSDLNDMVYQSNPGLDTRATIEPANNLTIRARRGGVTSQMFIPGSGTNMSGFGTVVKTGGDTVEEMVVRSPGSLKIAQAGNPEWYMGGNGRMFMNWNTRQTLLKALKYHKAWEAYEKGESTKKPAFDPIFDGFRGLFRKEYPVTVHTQIYQVVLMTVQMLAADLKLWVVTDHSEFDGWKVAPIVLQNDIWVMQGPRGFHFDRAVRKICGNANGWWKNGVRRLGLNTDAPVIPQEELFFQGTMGCWLGWQPYNALAGVTKMPAKALGLYPKTGSIEVGKDADFGIWTGNPIDPRSACLLTMINGKVEYDAADDSPRQF
ncbi:MAG: amidohydrolase family protein [Phycisphaerae bacterium]|nr:amidohydrolase family protein [Phycisphaerae bacterium]